MCSNQSVIRNVSFSEKLPLSNTRRNSQPFVEALDRMRDAGGEVPDVAHADVVEKLRPSSSTAVMRAVPAIM